MKNFLATKGIEPKRLHTVKPSNKGGLNHPNPHTEKLWINPHTLREAVAQRTGLYRFKEGRIHNYLTAVKRRAALHKYPTVVKGRTLQAHHIKKKGPHPIGSPQQNRRGRTL
jgi:hypothetical protein